MTGFGGKKMSFKKIIENLSKQTLARSRDGCRKKLIRLDTVAVEPEVGLWWLITGKIIRIARPWKDAPLEDGYHMLGDEHIHAWPDIQSSFAEVLPIIASLRYDDPERGRVWYMPEEDTFFITCSKCMKGDTDAIHAVEKAFGIIQRRVRVVNDPQYDVHPDPKNSDSEKRNTNSLPAMKKS